MRYRYRKVYRQEEVDTPWFGHILYADEEAMYRTCPEDVTLFYSFRHTKGRPGYVSYEYFEDEEDMMSYKSIVYNDPSIYKDFIQERKNEVYLAQLAQHRRRYE